LVKNTLEKEAKEVVKEIIITDSTRTELLLWLTLFNTVFLIALATMKML
jgi:hypothetical protein